MTYPQLSAACSRVGRRLLEAGARPGESIVLSLPDSVELAIGFIAALKVGAVPVLLGEAAQAEDIERIVAETSARLVVVDEHMAELCDETPRWYQTPKLIANPEHDSAWHWAGRIEPADLTTAAVLSTDRAFVQYTSGSTGIRKGVAHTHQSVVQACEMVGRRVFQFSEADRVLCTARMSFSFGLGFGLLMPLFAGATTIVPAIPSNLAAIRDAVVAFRPSIFCSVPTVLRAILAAWRGAEDVDWSTVRFVVSAGEPLPASIFHEFASRYQVEVLDGLGATELMTHVLSNRPGRARPSSCGVPVPGVEVRLVDDMGADPPQGVPGELWVKSKCAFQGYLGRPSENTCCQHGDWISTGDFLRQAPDGSFSFVGRINDTCKVQGLWVSPAEVAETLRACPGIQDAFVTSQMDSREHRRLVAYVVPDRASRFSESVLLAHCTELPLHTIPSAFLALRELPRLPNGKVNRAQLPAPDWSRLVDDRTETAI